MTDRKKTSENTNESLGPLHRVILDEPLYVWVSSCEPEDLGEALSACSRLPRHGERHTRSLPASGDASHRCGSPISRITPERIRELRGRMMEVKS